MASKPGERNGARTIDRALHATVAKVTQGMSPYAFAESQLDWGWHFAASPGLATETISRFVQSLTRIGLAGLQRQIGREAPDPFPRNGDPYERDPLWSLPPYAQIRQVHLALADAALFAVRQTRGVSPIDRARTEFVVHQAMDALAPHNNPFVNPDFWRRTLAEGGLNLWRGAGNLIEDASRQLDHRPPAGSETFTVGGNLAVTPGKVVYRNRLIELIQYAPQTPDVFAEPVLIVPAWIMKYYILDLSPENSLVRWLVERGHRALAAVIVERDVAVVGTRIAPGDHEHGVAALDAVTAITGGRPVHACG
jgi:polyhydroxyalkanoate synthase subunit PhaC